MEQHTHLGPFIRQLIKRPLNTVALAPSSRTLCDAMVAGLAPADGAVIELGPGTGKITESLLAQGFKQKQLTLFELNDDFHALLLPRFPKADIRLDTAENLASAKHKKVQAVVSGLPFLSFPESLQHNILSAAFEKMGPKGVYVQYTYGHKVPVRQSVLSALGLIYSKDEYIIGNLPPARVYRLRKVTN